VTSWCSGPGTTGAARPLGAWSNDYPPSGEGKAGLHVDTIEWMHERRIAAFLPDGDGETVPSNVEGVLYPIHPHLPAVAHVQQCGPIERLAERIAISRLGRGVPSRRRRRLTWTAKNSVHSITLGGKFNCIRIRHGCAKNQAAGRLPLAIDIDALRTQREILGHKFSAREGCVLKVGYLHVKKCHVEFERVAQPQRLDAKFDGIGGFGADTRILGGVAGWDSVGLHKAAGLGTPPISEVGHHFRGKIAIAD